MIYSNSNIWFVYVWVHQIFERFFSRHLKRRFPIKLNLHNWLSGRIWLHSWCLNAFNCVFFCRHHGAHERSRRCSEMHQQCWEAWETSGPDQALLQGYCALPNCHDEARWVFDVLLIRLKIQIDKFWLVPDSDERFEAFQLMTVLYHTGYIGEFEIIDDHRAGKIVVNLTGRLNKVQVCFLFPPLEKML